MENLKEVYTKYRPTGLFESVGSAIKKAQKDEVLQHAEESFLTIETLNKLIIDLIIDKKAWDEWIFIGSGVGDGVSDIKDYPCCYSVPTLYKTRNCDFKLFKVYPESNDDRTYYKGYELAFKNSGEDIVRVQDILAVDDKENNGKLYTILTQLHKKLRENPYYIDNR